MHVPRCRYIKTNGLICRSPSLKDRCYCYFHTRVNDRHRVYRLHQGTVDSPLTGAPLTISALEDTESVQLALSVVINALAAGKSSRSAPAPFFTACSLPPATPGT